MARLRCYEPTEYRVHKFILSSGERLALIVDAHSGIPPIIALRFLLRERHHGSSARVLVLARRLCELYDWYKKEWNTELEQTVYSRPDACHIGLIVALDDMDNAQYSSRRLRNQRIFTWRTFVSFLSRPDLWHAGLTIAESHSLRTSIQKANASVLADLDDEYKSAPLGRHHVPLTEPECGAIDIILRSIPRQGRFSARALARARVIYYLLRFGGIRIGELLTLTHSDLPPTEGRSAEMIREITGATRAISISRRPDCDQDPRQKEPRVKRRSRQVPLPDFVVQELMQYALDMKGRASDNYIIRTLDRSRPLSVSSTERLVKTIGKAAAAQLAESNPSSMNTLPRLSSHRLRATRAVELLPIFFTDLRWNELDQQAFLDFFGWADPKYAEPYLKTLYRANARKKLQKHAESLKASHD